MRDGRLKVTQRNHPTGRQLQHQVPAKTKGRYQRSVYLSREHQRLHPAETQKSMEEHPREERERRNSWWKR